MVTIPSRLVLPLLLLAGCGLDPSKLTAHQLYAKDSEELRVADELSFAVVGSTRSSLTGRGESGAATETVSDIRTQIPVRGLDFVVLTGDYVRTSSTSEWVDFAERWQDVLESELPSTNKARKRVLAMPGTGEILGDKRLQGYGATFEGTGRSIGHNRVASWSSFDLKVDRTTWRLVFLDAHRQALGSRWEEQIFWLPKVVTGQGFDRLIVLMNEPLVTLGSSATMDPGDGPSELLEIIEDHTEVMKLYAVITGGPPTNEAYLHSGNYGEIHVLAGNAGVPSMSLRRWGPADEAGLLDVSLDAGFDFEMLKEFDKWVEDLGFPDRVVDQAKARGSWDGFTAELDGTHFPIQGWWIVTLDDDELELTFRIRRHDGTFHDTYSTRFDDSKGWTWTPSE